MPLVSFKKRSVTYEKADCKLARFDACAGLFGVHQLCAIVCGGWYSINLTSGKAFINKLATNGGLTQIRLRFMLDDNNDAAANILSLYSGEATLTADRPRLLISYTVP